MIGCWVLGAERCNHEPRTKNPEPRAKYPEPGNRLLNADLPAEVVIGTQAGKINSE